MPVSVFCMVWCDNIASGHYRKTESNGWCKMRGKREARPPPPLVEGSEVVQLLHAVHAANTDYPWHDSPKHLASPGSLNMRCELTVTLFTRDEVVRATIDMPALPHALEVAFRTLARVLVPAMVQSMREIQTVIGMMALSTSTVLVAAGECEAIGSGYPTREDSGLATMPPPPPPPPPPMTKHTAVRERPCSNKRAGTSPVNARRL